MPAKGSPELRMPDEVGPDDDARGTGFNLSLEVDGSQASLGEGMRRPCTVIGVGNPYRRDDGVGRVVAQRLKTRLLEPFTQHAAPQLSEPAHPCEPAHPSARPLQVEILETRGDAFTLLELLTGLEQVWIVDAVCTGEPPGTRFWLDASQQPLPPVFASTSTHSFGVAEALELARLLGKLPAQVWVLGIEGGDFLPGEGLSPEVTAVVAEAVEALLERIRQAH